MSNKKNTLFPRKILSIVISNIFIATPVVAADFLSLVQYPAGSGSVEPAPNVIVSVDNSGSMGDTGIAALKSALNTAFSATNVPDNRIRLAWQSMNSCNGIPATGCNNSMKPLSGTHRTNFLNWVSTLNDSGYTPSHQMVINAGEYMKTTGTNSPWNLDPGTADNAPLTCRKAFHIFMTDGEWNGTTGGSSPDGSRTLTAYKRMLDPNNTSANLDGVNRTLPDGTSYSVTGDQTRVYRDSWGFASATKSDGTTDTNGINSLADLSFHYWATDLQTGISNGVRPIIKKAGSETFTVGASTATIQEYWNPKNDPATWQHLVTYTVGFNNAADLTRPNGTTWPIFNNAEGTWGGDFPSIAAGVTGAVWPSPFCGNSGDKPCETGFGNPADKNAYNDTLIGRARMYELWHMAINGRGKFIPATTDAALANAFTDIISTIIEDTAQPITSFASASSSISNQGTVAYVSSYEADGWKGGIYSKSISANTGVLTNNPDWGIISSPSTRPKTTGDKLDELTATNITNRLILSYNDNTNAGVSFAWANLSTAQQALLNKTEVGGTTDTLGSDRVNFIRGDRTKEGGSGATPFRVRRSRQGDIVNSSVWYVARPANGYTLEGYRTFATSHANRLPMLYVGGNDGMLHGFSAVDGTEKIAFIPQGVMKNLPNLTKSGYTHRYYVDGSPMSGDVNLGVAGTPDWRTMLVGTLGAGGKGYFVLDITKPGFTGSTGVASNFATGSASTLVVMDKTSGADADIGNIFGDPVTSEFNNRIATQITKMNNGRWAVVLGNGINSTNEDPVLLIQYLDGDKSLKKINAASTGTESSENGLAAPRLVDLNGDGTPDVIYAGDLRGNLWKFDVSNADSDNWGVAFSGSPLYKAVYAANTATGQPITTAPMVRPNTSAGGLMIAFGTGRSVTEGDRTDATVQTFYSVWDNTRYKLDPAAGANKGKILVDTSSITPATVGTGRTNLVARTFESSVIAGSGTSVGDEFWRMGTTQTSLSFSGPSAKKGWYFEFPLSGERVLRHPEPYSNSNVIEILSDIPASGGNTEGESCDPASTPAKAYRTFLGIELGLKPTVQLLDTNGDGVYNSAATADNNTNRTTASPEELKLTGKGKQVRIGKDIKRETADLPKPPVNINWRQLQ